MNHKICIISTVHSAFDVRVYFKEAKSLQTQGYQISLIVKHPQNLIVEGIKIVALPDIKSRLRRILILPLRALSLALQERASLYHFHDPELLFIGFLLKILTRSAVIYDAHEDFPSTVFAREWIPEKLKPILSKTVNILELTLSRIFDAVITADPAGTQRFAEVNHNITMLLNVPPRELVNTPPADMRTREKSLVHIGSLSRSRGIWFMLEVLERLVTMNVDFQLDIYVKTTPDKILADFSKQITEKEFDSYVNIVEEIPYEELLQKLKYYQIGLIPFLNMEKYRKNIATKMFDYMAAGLAVIASDLPPQRCVIAAAECGELIQPEDPEAFAEAIRELLINPEKVYVMGVNGWSAIQNQYCWEEEEIKLFKLYADLLG